MGAGAGAGAERREGQRCHSSSGREVGPRHPCSSECRGSTAPTLHPSQFGPCSGFLLVTKLLFFFSFGAALLAPFAAFLNISSALDAVGHSESREPDRPVAVTVYTGLGTSFCVAPTG